MIPGLGAGMDPRQMSMMMKKFGIDVREIEGVEQVIVRAAGREYVFDKASVSVMKAQGVETWQVSGKPRIVERTSSGSAGSATPATTAPAPGASAPGPTASSVPPPLAPAAAPTPLEIPEEDVTLVMTETGKGRAEALAALKATNGDLAEAILKLSP